MDSAYAQAVRLLLTTAPDVFRGKLFAMKGGTAINFFVRDMPRLSVDIDLVYTAWQHSREQALRDIKQEVDAIGQRLAALGLQTRKVPSKDQIDTRLNIENELSQVKVEVNTVFRGTVLPPEQRRLRPRAAEMFSMDLELPILHPDELYGSKLVAALDQQHPRDLFDAWQLLESEGLSDGVVECFVTYLAGHNRPIHEVLFGNDKNISVEYHSSFVGMTTDPVTLEALLTTRAMLRRELPRRLTSRQRAFLVRLAYGQPDWALLQCPHAADLPALRWKLANLEAFRKKRPADFEAQAEELDKRLG